MQLKSGSNPLGSEAPVAPTSSWRGFSPEGETLPEDPFETLWQRVAAWFFLLLGVGYFFGIARWFTNAEDIMFGYMKSFILISVSWGVLLFLYRRRFNTIEREHKIARTEAPEPPVGEDWIPCRVQAGIYQEGVMTGEDDGFIWIHDGTLFFRGFHMAFRLNREDVPPLELWPRSNRPGLSDLRLPKAIPITIDGRQIGLSIKYFDPYRDFETRRCAMHFQKQFVLWLKDRPEGCLESLLPPVSLHPKLAKDGFVLRESILAAAVLSLVGSMLVVGTMPGLGPVDFGWTMRAMCFAISLVLAGLALNQAMNHLNGLNVRRRLASTPEKTL